MNDYLEIKNISKTFNTSKKLRVLKNLFSNGAIWIRKIDTVKFNFSDR